MLSHSAVEYGARHAACGVQYPAYRHSVASVWLLSDQSRCPFTLAAVDGVHPRVDH